jgi:hypothetical protein
VVSVKKIYVAHPFGGKPENMQAIAEVCRKIVKLGAMPVSPVHMFSFMDDGVPEERKRALEFCTETIPDMDEFWLCGEWEKSEGCQSDLFVALSELIPIRIVIGWDGDVPIFAEEKEPSADTES